MLATSAIRSGLSFEFDLNEFVEFELLPFVEFELLPPPHELKGAYRRSKADLHERRASWHQAEK